MYKSRTGNGDCRIVPTGVIEDEAAARGMVYYQRCPGSGKKLDGLLVRDADSRFGNGVGQHVGNRHIRSRDVAQRTAQEIDNPCSQGIGVPHFNRTVVEISPSRIGILEIGCQRKLAGTFLGQRNTNVAIVADAVVRGTFPLEEIIVAGTINDI